MNEPLVPRTPGETLAGLRQKAGRSLEDLSAATKIPLPMLQALELDEYHKISGELYVKSFLRSYATELGMEAEEILALYGNYTGSGSAAPTPEGGTPVWQEDEVQIKRVGPPWGLIGIVAAAAVVLVAGGFFLLKGLSGDSDPATGLEQDPGPGQEIQAPADSVVTIDEAPAEEARETQSGTDEVLVTPALVVKQADELPPAVPGLSGQLAVGGRSWPVVLRLLGPDRRQISLKKDGDRSYSQVDWPAQVRPLPEQGIKPGTAYNVREGLVIYWGAEDHFSLKVDDPADYRATINGQYRDISDLKAGVEIILNDPDVIKANLPAPPGERP
jgi:hypothetical protein